MKATVDEEGNVRFVCACPERNIEKQVEGQQPYMVHHHICEKHRMKAEAITQTMVQYFEDQETVKKRLESMGYFG